MVWDEVMGIPDPISLEEWFCIIVFGSSFLYTQNYPIANGVTMLLGFSFAGIMKLPIFKKAKI